MKITGIVWLEEIVAKLERKHQVSPQEIREVFANKPRFRFVEKGHRPDENLYFASGRTHAGRYLIVFFVYKQDGQALILSSRTMTSAERKRHGRK